MTTASTVATIALGAALAAIAIAYQAVTKARAARRAVETYLDGITLAEDRLRRRHLRVVPATPQPRHRLTRHRAGSHRQATTHHPAERTPTLLDHNPDPCDAQQHLA